LVSAAPPPININTALGSQASTQSAKDDEASVPEINHTRLKH